MTTDTTDPQPKPKPKPKPAAPARRLVLYAGYTIYQVDVPSPALDQDLYDRSFDEHGVNALDPTLYRSGYNARCAAESDHMHRYPAWVEFRWWPAGAGWRLETITGEDTGVRVGMAVGTKRPLDQDQFDAGPTPQPVEFHDTVAHFVIQRANAMGHHPIDHAVAPGMDRRFVAQHLRKQAQQLDPRPQIVTLCGSTEFMDEFTEVNRRETAAGNVVLSVGCNLKEPHPLWDTEEELEQLKLDLDALHRHKIDMADRVIVVGTRIGTSTRDEIALARQLGKPVAFEHPDVDPDQQTAPTVTR
ncbi:hypothetical protein ACIP9H_34095 [Streptomyces sp. NPDC088732]|uniref:hypothetical protein n=1 Tax=Streptomyces sp. NPDC088732 TaxID=3365879 RepID=UPI0037FC6F59